MSHTEGPWFAEATPGWALDTRAPRYRVVAMMGEPGDDEFRMDVMYPEDGNEQPDDAQALANAHLIAAAPELLEALEQVMRNLGDTDYDGRDFLEGKAKALSALAKARGES